MLEQRQVAHFDIDTFSIDIYNTYICINGTDMHRSIFADECEHFAHLFTVTICTTFSSVSLFVFFFFVVALRSLFANRILFFALVFSILWLLYCECFMHYTLAVIASGYSILIRSHSLLSVCTKILSQHLPNRIFQWICAYDKRHSEKNVNIHTHIYSFWSMERQMSRSESES